MKCPSKTVWICFFIHTLIIVASYPLSDKLPYHEPAGFIDQSLYPLSPYVEKLIKWDAHWYTHIAGQGYTPQSIVFFPAIIVFIKILSYFGLNLGVAGLIICNLFAFLSFWIMYLTFQLDYSEKEVNYALLSYAVMPTSLFLNSIYTEPIFMASSLACVYSARVGRWWYAGVAGALATLTRNLGIFLVFFLLYEFIQTYPQLRKGKYRGFSILLLPIALFLFMIYNFFFTGRSISFYCFSTRMGQTFGVAMGKYMEQLAFNLCKKSC